MTVPLLLTLAASAFRSAYGLPNDPVLDRPLAIEARIEPLPDLLDRVGKELGVPLTVERRMAGLKATVLTDARPARLTLAGLASVFDAEWTPGKDGGYRLAETVPARNRRLAHGDLEDQERRRRVETFLGPEASRRPSFLSASGRDAARTAEIEGGFGGMALGVARLYRESAPDDRRRFWNGEILHRIDATPAREREGRPPVPAGRSLLVARTRTDEGGVRFLLISPGWTASSHQTLPNSARVNESNDSAFRRAQAAWTTNARTSAAPELDRELVASEPVRPEWADGGWTDSDTLETLHRATGSPVIGEAFRRTREPRSLRTGVPLREAWIAAGLGGHLRWENGALLLRPDEFLTRRALEPSEAALRAFEAAPPGDSSAALDAAAELYASVPVMGVRAVVESAARRSTRALHEGRWALRVWGRLDRSERAAALTPAGLPLARMRPETRAAVSEATLESLFDLGIDLFEGAGGVDPVPAERRSEIAIALLGLGSEVPLVLRAERPTDGKPSLPVRGGTMADYGHPERFRMVLRTGLILRLADEAGRGLRLLAPEPNPLPPPR